MADPGRDSGLALTPGGFNSLTIADSMAGRTLKFFSCLFRSDFAALGASLTQLLGTEVRNTHTIEHRLT